MPDADTARIATYHTEYSVYEVNETDKTIRRLEGTSRPTMRQGEDGVWKPYQTLLVEAGGLVIVWGKNPDGTLASTITSPVWHAEIADADA